MGIEFHPRLAIVVIILTIVVAVAGWRIFRESGALRIKELTGEAMAVFVSLQEESASMDSMDLAEAEKRIFDFSGVLVNLPRDDSGFIVFAVEKWTMRKRPAVGVRFSYENGRHMLVVSRKDFKRKSPFPDESLLSGELDGCSFVFWEREDASFIMVSDTDVMQAFRLVRNFFN